LTDTVKKCTCCGEDLGQWGIERRGLCPCCSDFKKNIKVKCAGRCGCSYSVGYMECVSIYANAGKKGSKKYKLYYCSSCSNAATSRARKTCSSQNEIIDGIMQHHKTALRKARKKNKNKHIEEEDY